MDGAKMQKFLKTQRILVPKVKQTSKQTNKQLNKFEQVLANNEH